MRKKLPAERQMPIPKTTNYTAALIYHQPRRLIAGNQPLDGKKHLHQPA
jgi:hypothetical protein